MPPILPPPTSPTRRRVMPRAAWALVLALGVAAPAQLVAAQPAAAARPEDRERQALVLSAQARDKYHAKDYAQAAALFMQAYAQVPEPTLVYNAARAYQQAGALREAKPLFQLYLSLNRFDDDESRAGRRDAEQHLATIEAELARQAGQRPAGPQPPEPAEPEPGKVTPGKATPGEPAPGDPALEPPPGDIPAEPQAAPPPSVRRPGLFERVQGNGWSSQKIAAASAATGGVALLVTAGILSAVASSDLADFDAQLAAGREVVGGTVVYRGVTQRAAQDALDDHDGKQRWAGILTGVGLAAIGTGVALWLLEDDSASAAAALRPGLHVAGDGVVGSVHGRF